VPGNTEKQDIIKIQRGTKENRTIGKQKTDPEPEFLEEREVGQIGCQENTKRLRWHC
jgi:hypothetical protein